MQVQTGQRGRPRVMIPTMAGEGPRFRRDLDARPLEIDGIAYVDATDPRSGSIFRFYDFEHAVAEVLDGRDLGEVVTEARAKSGYQVTTEQLSTFIDKLGELGFLEVGNELGNDDATAAGPPPPGILEATKAEPEPPPELDEPLEEPLIAQGSTEKLPILRGSTDKLPLLARPVEEPAAESEQADPALEPRAGELLSAQPTARTISPTGELELAPPAEANVVAAELDESDETLADLPGSEDPTKIERRPDEHKNTLFGVPFHEVDKLVAAARTATPPPVLTKAAETRSEPTAEKPAAEAAKPTVQTEAATKALADAPPETKADAKPEAAAETKSDEPAKPDAALEPEAAASPDELADAEAALPHVAAGATTELAPLDALTPFDVTEEVTSPVGSLVPPAPFPPAPSVMVVAPFPPAATPAPLASVPAISGIEHPAVAVSAELPAVAPTPKPRPQRLSPILFAAAGVILAVAITFYGFRLSSTSEPGAIAVRTIVPTPGPTYRWFEAAGAIKSAGEHTLTFTSGGKVLRVMGPGTVFHAGDVIAEVEGGAGPFKQALDHNRQRLAYYQKRLEQMKAENNRPEIHQAELKIAEKQRLITEAQAGLSRQGVVATSGGEIAEALVTPGTTVKAGAPVARTKGTDWRAEFELSREDADRARHLGFCRLEVEGKQIDCSLSAEGGDETHVFVDLPADAGVPAGKPARLAKARYDGVFVLPATALVPTKGTDRRVYVVKDGRAESYAVVLADQTPTEIVVTQGLEPGSAVVAEVPNTLRPRAMVTATASK
jgi:hypothetical protein